MEQTRSKHSHGAVSYDRDQMALVVVVLPSFPFGSGAERLGITSVLITPWWQGPDKDNKEIDIPME